MSVDKSVEDIIQKSGNSFHCKVVNKLKELGWHTLISPYYMDSSTNKPREIDLVAEKAIPYSFGSFGQRRGTINFKLYIECKYIPNKVVFWFDKKDRKSTREWLVAKTSLRENNTLTEEHRYLATNGNVAKLFAGETGRDQENEVMYKALNQCLNALVSNRWGNSIIPEGAKGNPEIFLTVEYPVILCNSFDNFHMVTIDDQSRPSRIQNNFQLEVNYAYRNSNSKHVNDYFLIDVINFDLLKDFLGWVESDSSRLGYMLK